MKFELTKRYERVDERLLAVDAVVALVVEEWVGGRASVAHRKQVVAVVKRLRSNRDCTQVHRLLKNKITINTRKYAQLPTLLAATVQDTRAQPH